jgi:hypothetical protein
MALIKFKRGLASEWTALNPVLSLGEPGFEKDTGKLKIGDGTTSWNGLNYLVGEGGDPLTLENIDDRVDELLVAGVGISLDYDDENDSLTINTNLTTQLTSGTNINLVYSEISDTLTINLDFSGVPTSDPLISGKLWLDTLNGNVLKVSSGS